LPRQLYNKKKADFHKGRVATIRKLKLSKIIAKRCVFKEREEKHYYKNSLYARNGGNWEGRTDVRVLILTLMFPARLSGPTYQNKTMSQTLSASRKEAIAFLK